MVNICAHLRIFLPLLYNMAMIQHGYDNDKRQARALQFTTFLRLHILFRFVVRTHNFVVRTQQQTPNLVRVDGSETRRVLEVSYKLSLGKRRSHRKNVDGGCGKMMCRHYFFVAQLGFDARNPMISCKSHIRVRKTVLMEQCCQCPQIPWYGQHRTHLHRSHLPV